MTYVQPEAFTRAMIDAGAKKGHMFTLDTLICCFMAGAILALGAAFAVTVTVQTGSAMPGAALFPVGFILLYLLASTC